MVAHFIREHLLRENRSLTTTGQLIAYEFINPGKLKMLSPINLDNMYQVFQFCVPQRSNKTIRWRPNPLLRSTSRATTFNNMEFQY